jgi:hypothetical protein
VNKRSSPSESPAFVWRFDKVEHVIAAVALRNSREFTMHDQRFDHLIERTSTIEQTKQHLKRLTPASTGFTNQPRGRFRSLFHVN